MNKELVVDWSKIPEEFNFVVRNSGGVRHMCRYLPALNSRGAYEWWEFRPGDGVAINDPALVATQERPKPSAWKPIKDCTLSDIALVIARYNLKSAPHVCTVSHARDTPGGCLYMEIPE